MKQLFDAPKELLAVAVVGGMNFLIGYSFTYVTFMDTDSGGSGIVFESIIGSISVFTANFGVILYAVLANKYGRKISLMFVYIFFIAGVIVIMISRQPMAFLISRSIIGVATGGRATTILYTSEVARKNRRGTYVAFYGVLAVLGILMTYITQYFLTIYGVGMITLVISILGCTGIIVLPESKYWYIINNQRVRAKQSASWFDPSLTNDEIEKELNKITVDNDNSKGAGGVIACLRKPNHFRQFLLATLLVIFRTGCGREPLAVYPTNFFSRLNLVYNPKIISILQGCVDFFVSVLCTVVIDSFKRRTLLIFNASICTFSLAIIMILQFFDDYINETVPWLPLVFIFCYTGGVIAFLFPMVSLMACEVVSASNKHRNTIFNISWLVNNVIRGIYTAFFPAMINNFHIDVTLGVFLVSNVLLMLLIKFWVAETANKALHECVEDVKKPENPEIVNEVELN